jgi:TRAP-type mannitol/chloroaromatic compound transport system permease small subunit
MHQPTVTTGRTPGWVKVVNAIDGFTSITGQFFAWIFVLPLVGAVAFEVVARYGFDAPTIWAYDTSYMLYGAMFMLGTAYALLRGAHIRTDMLWEQFSDRTKGLIDLCAYLIFFFPALAIFFFSSVDDFLYSWQIGERSEQTAWRPILYPFKGVIPLTALLLMIQGVSEVLKSLYAVRTGRLYRHVEGIQI